jgi:hypothetical protein
MRPFQYRLRTLLCLVLLACVALSLYASRVEQARRERQALRTLCGWGGTFASQYQDPGGSGPDDQQKMCVAGGDPAPAWLRAEARLIGSNVLAWGHVTDVCLHCQSEDKEPGTTPLAAEDCAAACRQIGYFTGLQRLFLCGDLFTDACLEFCDRRPPLLNVCLQGPHLTDAGLAHLTGLDRLECLSLVACPVTDVGLRHLRGMPRLTVLVLAETQVVGTGLEYLGRHSALTDLDLTHSRANDAGMQAVAALPRLETLKLAETAVSDAGLPWIARLSQLEELDLSDTAVSDAGLAHLGGLSRLKHLDLHRSAVSDAGVASLGRLSSLRELDLGATGVTNAGLKTLRDRLPQCNVSTAIAAPRPRAAGAWDGPGPSIRSDFAMGRTWVKNGSSNLFVFTPEVRPIEQKAKSGNWLVWFCADWSIDDAAQVKLTSALADSLRGTAKVAVQQYQAYEDISKMYPELRRPGPFGFPLWVLLSDGKKIGHLIHPGNSDAIVAFVEKKLAGTEKRGATKAPGQR